MKNVFKLCILVLSFSILGGCQSEDEFEKKSNQTEIAEGDIAIIKALGLDETTIVDMGDYYLVEGDIMLLKDKIKEYLSNGPTTRQGYVPEHLISDINAQNITVRIDNSISTTGSGRLWRDAVEEAIEAWNSIPNCLLSLSLTASSNADITVRLGHNNNPDIIAWAPLPSNSKPGATITINDLIFDTYQFRTHTITHEIGHTVGLLHSHVRPNEEHEDGVLIPGTPEIDNTSIMSYYGNRSLYPGFSFHDVIAIQTLYPLSNEHIISSVEIVSPDEMVTFTIPGYTGTANWTAVENATLVSEQGSSATFKASGNGYINIQASYTYSGHQFSFQNNRVWVGTPLVAINHYCENIYDTYCDLNSAGAANQLPKGSLITFGLNGGGTSGSGGSGIYDWEWERMTEEFEFVNYNSVDGGKRCLYKYATLKINRSGTLQFKVRAKNKNGWGYWKYVTWTIYVS